MFFCQMVEFPSVNLSYGISRKVLYHYPLLRQFALRQSFGIEGTLFNKENRMGLLAFRSPWEKPPFETFEILLPKSNLREIVVNLFSCLQIYMNMEKNN